MRKINMFPNKETVGIVLSQNEVVVAQFAYERAHDVMRTDDELALPAPNEEGLFVLDNFSALQVLSAAKLAHRISDQYLWEANNRYVTRRHDHAEIEELQMLSIDRQCEVENVAQFNDLYRTTEDCLLASQDILIDRKLSEQSADI